MRVAIPSPSLPPGPYELAAEMEGFRGYQQTGIVLELGQTLRRDIRLEVGQVTESVSVTAEVTLLNTESGTIKGDVIVQQEIEDLPLEGRDFTDLALLVPGVLPKAEGGQGSAMNINGARADSTNFYVDGFNNRNAKGAAAQVRPNMGAMQEFKMEVSGYSAEYGRMAGGILNMVMRSGTNQYHGDVFEYVRNNVMDARAFFDTEKAQAEPAPVRRYPPWSGMAAETLRRSQQNLLHVQLGELPAACGNDRDRPRAERAGAGGQLFPVVQPHRQSSSP